MATCPQPEFVRHVGEALVRLGYRDPVPVSPPSPRRKNHTGGYDLVCRAGNEAHEGGGRRKVLVQIKRTAPGGVVDRRFRDQLAGACLREGAVAGVIVTTGAFSKAAREDAARAAAARRLSPGSPGALAGLIPVELVDGRRLADLLRGSAGAVPVPQPGHDDGPGPSPLTAALPKRPVPPPRVGHTGAAGPTRATVSVRVSVTLPGGPDGTGAGR